MRPPWQERWAAAELATAITYGYQRFDAFATLTTATVLIVIVQLIQTLGTRGSPAASRLIALPRRG